METIIINVEKPVCSSRLADWTLDVAGECCTFISIRRTSSLYGIGLSIDALSKHLPVGVHGEKTMSNNNIVPQTDDKIKSVSFKTAVIHCRDIVVIEAIKKCWDCFSIKRICQRLFSGRKALDTGP